MHDGSLSKTMGDPEWISETGSAGEVSNVIVSPIGANNLTVGLVQSEVKLAPAAVYSLGFMLLRKQFPFA